MHSSSRPQHIRARILVFGRSALAADSITRTLHAVLAGSEFEYHQVYSDETFGIALKDTPWNLILCEIAPTLIDSATTLGLAAKLQPPAPVIMLSASPTLNDAVEMMRLGARGVVEKSDHARLGDLVRQELAQSGPLPENHTTLEIAARKNMEEALRASEARYRSIVEDQIELVCRYDPQLRVTFANDAYCKAAGQPREALLGTSFIERVPIEDRESAWTHIHALTAENPIAVHVHRSIQADGRVHWMEWKDRALFDAEGNVVEYQGVGRDITDQRLAEFALQESTQQLRLFVEHAPAAIAMLDNNMRYLAVSHRWLSDYRLTHRDIIGLSHYEVFPDIPDAWKAVHRRCLAGAVESSEGDPFPRTDGRLDWVRWEIRPWMDYQGQIGGILLFTEVITDRKNAEDALRRSEKRLAGMHNLDRAITSAASLDELVRLALDHLAQIIPCHHISISTIDWETNTLIELGSIYGGKAAPGQGRTHVLSPDRASLIKDRSFRVIENFEHSTHPALQEQYRDGVRSILSIGLRSNGDVIGLLTLHAAQTQYFVGETLEIALEISRQLAIGLHKAMQNETMARQIVQLEESEKSLKRYAERLKVLHSIDLGLIKGGSVEALIETVLGELRHLIPCQRAEVTIHDPPIPGEAILAMFMAVDLASETEMGKSEQIELPPDVFAIFDSQHRVVLNDLRLLPGSFPNLPYIQKMIQEGLLSALRVLLMDGETPIGSLGLLANSAGFFTEEYQAVTSEIADQLAVAIRQMRLDKEIARHTAELEQRVAERTVELERAKDRLEAIFNHSGDAILMLDIEQGIQQANYAFAEMFGVSTGDYLGMPLQTYFEAENVLSLEDIIRDVADRHRRRNIELRAKRPGGKDFDVEISLAPVNRSDKAATNLVCIIRDITERKRTDAELHALSRRLQLATEAGGIGIWDWNPQTDRVVADDRLLNIFGLNHQVFRGTGGEIWQRAERVPDDYARLRQEVAQALEGKKPLDAEYRIEVQPGELRYLKTRAVVFRDLDKQPVRMIGVTWDITILKQAEENLRLALDKEKELGVLKTRFVSMASHEFRTPLATILAAVETLRMYRNRMDESQINARLEKVHRQVDHMKGIIEDVLQLARVQDGRIDYEPSKGNLHALCNEIVEELEGQPQHQGRIHYECAAPSEKLLFDAKLMWHVVNNLITNALKYSAAEKPVYVSLTYEDSNAVLQVQDQGIGIPPEDLSRLFEPFHRAGNVGSISGTGLGLSIAKQMVELHGGTLTVTSQVGVGTTFTATIPR